MKLEIQRHGLQIIPENKTEEAYIEEVLGLKEDGDWVKCTRINASNLSCIAYLEIKKSKGGEGMNTQKNVIGKKTLNLRGVKE